MNQPAKEELKEGEISVVSVKKRVKQTLPENQTYIYQPNKLTNAKYKSSLVSERLLTAIQAQLQDAVMLSMKGINDYKQTSLFQDNLITVEVPLKILTKGNTLKNTNPADSKQYVYEICHSLMDMKFEFPFTSEDGKTQYRAIRHVVHGIDIPEKSTVVNGQKRVFLKSAFFHFTPDQAELFCKIDYDFNNKRPKNYTKFLLHTAINAKNKYTPRLYKIISSWSKKGGFVISIVDLKERLGIISADEKTGALYDFYPNYSDFVKRVLNPVKAELYKKTDCWFEFAPSAKDGKKVTHLQFKVITPLLEKDLQTKIDYAKNLLRSHFQFDDKDMKSVDEVFKGDFDAEEFYLKLFEIKDHISSNKDKIGNVKAYVVRSLHNNYQTKFSKKKE